MRKILVGLRVPSIQEKYDLFIPSDMDIGLLTELLTDGVKELSEGRYRPCAPNLLTMENAKLPLNPEKSLEDYGAEDGVKLTLF